MEGNEIKELEGRRTETEIKPEKMKRDRNENR